MHLEQARVVVVTLPDEAAATIVVATVRDMAPQVPIIARAATQEGARRLSEEGADAVIQPELEGGLMIMRETLARLDYQSSEIQRYTDTVRHEHYDLSLSTVTEQEVLSQMGTPRA